MKAKRMMKMINPHEKLHNAIVRYAQDFNMAVPCVECYEKCKRVYQDIDFSACVLFKEHPLWVTINLIVDDLADLEEELIDAFNDSLDETIVGVDDPVRYDN